MLGRVFKCGDTLAVTIPGELGVVDVPGTVDLERVGNTLVIRTLPMRSLAGLTERFAAFPPGFMTTGRESHPEGER